jgi:photosystem II stability/assembly factor-like uncharacterized protein
MKKTIYIPVIILFVIILNEFTYTQGSWEKIISPTDKDLNSIFFVDSLYGWAVGDSGIIIHSTNGGNDWTTQNSNTLNKIVDVFFLNRNSGWAISWLIDAFPFKTILLSTTDGGINWIGDPYREDEILMSCVLFLDSLKGWMVGNPHAMVRTTDSGSHWEQAEIDTVTFAFFPVISIAFYNETYGYACGGQFDIAGVTWRTSNGGEKWFPINGEEAPADPIQEIHIIDSLNVIGIGGDIEGFYGIDVIRTTDGGVFWEYETLVYTGVPLDLDFRSETEVWAPLGSDRKFLVSTDAGTTWEQIATPETAAISDVMFADSMHGFAAGEQGAILRYKPPIIDDIKQYVNIQDNSFNLSQNYPNPFNPITKIKYNIPVVDAKFASTTNVQLKVYDVLGNEVATLVDEYKSAGNYEAEFSAIGGSASGGNAATLPSGVYFYQLRVGSFIETKKMILIK